MCAFVIIAAVLQISVLFILSKLPPIKYRQITTGTKSTDEYKKVYNTSFLKMTNYDCLLCSKPLIYNETRKTIYEFKFKFGNVYCISWLIQAPCDHFFHTQCLHEQSKNNCKCPLDGCEFPSF